MKKWLVLLLLGIGLSAAAAERDRKGETPVTEKRPLTASYTAIEAAAVRLVIDETLAAGSIVVTGPHERLDKLVTEVESGRLVIRFRPNESTSMVRRKVIDPVTVQVPYRAAVDTYELRSGASLQSDRTLQAPTLHLTATSSARIECAVEAKQAELSATSGSVIRLTGRLGTTTAEAHSSSRIEAAVGGRCTASASSGSVIRLSNVRERIEASATNSATVEAEAAGAEAQLEATSGSVIRLTGRLSGSEMNASSSSRIEAFVEGSCTATALSGATIRLDGEATDAGATSDPAGRNGEVVLRATSSSRIEAATLRAARLTAETMSGSTIQLGRVESGSVRLTATSSSRMEGIIEAEMLTATAMSGSTLMLSGRVDHLKADMRSSARLEGPDLITRTADCSATSGSKIRIICSESLDAMITSGSSLYYGGNGRLNRLQTHGGTIRHE